MNSPRHALGIAGLIGVVAAMACGKDTGKDTAPSRIGPTDLDGSVAHGGDAAGVPGDDASGPSSDDGAAPVDAGPIVAPQPEPLGGRPTQHDGIVGKQRRDISAQSGNQLRLQGRSPKRIERQYPQRRPIRRHRRQRQLQLQQRTGDTDRLITRQNGEQ